MRSKNEKTNANYTKTANRRQQPTRNLLMMFGLMVAVCFGQALSAQAATFTVNSVSDPGVGTCDATECTLREAITAARTASGDDTVEFDLSLDSQKIMLTNEISIDSSNGEMNGAITINGLGANRLTIDGGKGLNRVFKITLGTITINEVTITGGNGNRDTAGFADGYGGAILVLNSGTTLNLNHSRVTGNFASVSGGGLATGLSAQVNITDSTFDKNRAGEQIHVPNPGGAITVLTIGTTLNLNRSRVTENFATGGGGGLIAVDSAQANITNSTIDQNESLCQGGAIDSQQGGNVDITNSTVSGNVAHKIGGGISQTFDAGGTTITNSTVTNNTTPVSGGGIALDSGTSFIVRNSIVSGNTDTNPSFGLSSGYTHDTYSQMRSFTSEGFNLVGTSEGSTGFVNGVNNDKVGSLANLIDALLGPLQDNGGPTLTHALLPGSPAIDAGNSTLTTDQRGVLRPIDFLSYPNAANGSDIGAFELRTPPTDKDQCKKDFWKTFTIEMFRNQGGCVSFVQTKR